jgi:hypothetical protein
MRTLQPFAWRQPQSDGNDALTMRTGTLEVGHGGAPETGKQNVFGSISEMLLFARGKRKRSRDLSNKKLHARRKRILIRLII